ncbi:MAG TPA: hypothetical protein VEV82_08965 [Actinomycetota bacterium]|nr:hypothetical protein [Actinomycetota bacterium]
MKALVIENGSAHLRERELPAPELDQILVQVASAGINRADLLQIAGYYPAAEAFDLVQSNSPLGKVLLIPPA